MNSPLLVQSSVAAALTAVACAGLTPGAAAQGSLRDLLSSRQPAQPTAVGFPQAGNAALSAPSPQGVTPYGGTVQAAVEPVLWDQPPAVLAGNTIAEGERVPSGAFDIYQVHDVVFTEGVNLTSICMWYTNFNSTWPDLVTEARLNIFDGDPLPPSDDPTTGTVVAVTTVLDGSTVRVKALIDIDLAAGAYRIGLAPIGDFDGATGAEFHINSDVVIGEETYVRNLGGGFGIGTDWGPVSVLSTFPFFEGSIRIGGTALGSCSNDCASTYDQTPNLLNAHPSDADTSRAVADDCTLTEPTELCELVVWGTYAFGQTPPSNDLFTLTIHTDAAGLPGTMVYSEGGIAHTRTSTGGTIGASFEEFRYTLTPALLVILQAGTYWFEVTNNTATDADDNWFWETGDPDVTPGIAGSADAFEVPGTTWSMNLDSDRAMQVVGKPATCMTDCPVGSDATVLQPSDLISAYYSDVNPINGGPLDRADDFAFDERTEICEIRVKGAYGNFNTPSVPDDFTVIIHSDLAGLPGPAIHAESGVGGMRTATGAFIQGFTEYEYVLTPSTTVVLDAGTYWLEVYNDTTGDDDDTWFWATATVDPNGISGHVRAFDLPGVVWFNEADDLAFRICGKSPEICVSYCASLPNATGSAAVLTCSGIPNSSLVLTSSPVPNTTGQFFFGPMMLGGGSSLGDGLRCVGGSLTRLLPFIGAGMMMQLPNTASFTVNYTAPYALGLSGTQYFQHWYRSGLGTGTGSNTSNAVSITF